MSDPETSPAVIWHDAECGRYRADLPLWRELAVGAGGAVLDVGAGTGRVALDLAARGHEVVALDRDAALLAALRARSNGFDVATVQADARAFALERRFALVLVPMQTVQLLLGPEDRASFFACARAHLAPGGVLAAALADPFEGFDAEHTEPPRPDVAQHAGVRYVSQPVAVRAEREAMVIERIRRTITADGSRTAEADAVRLARLDAAALEREGLAAGLRVRARRRVEATAEHVGSAVVMLGV